MPFADVLVDPFSANAWLVVDFEIAADLLGAPVLFNQLVDTLPCGLRNAVMVRLISTRAAQTLRLFGTIPSQAGIALQLSTDCRRGDIKLRRNCLLRQSGFLQCVKFDTAFTSEAIIIPTD